MIKAQTLIELRNETDFCDVDELEWFIRDETRWCELPHQERPINPFYAMQFVVEKATESYNHAATSGRRYACVLAIANMADLFRDAYGQEKMEIAEFSGMFFHLKNLLIAAIQTTSSKKQDEYAYCVASQLFGIDLNSSKKLLDYLGLDHNTGFIARK